MIKIRELRELIHLADVSSIDELQLENGGIQIVLKKRKQQDVTPVFEEINIEEIENVTQQVAATLEEVQSILSQETSFIKKEEQNEKIHNIISNYVGIFSATQEIDRVPYIKIGDEVKEGLIVGKCSIECLKLYHEIESQVCGEIIDILVEDGQLIEYGQPLFLVKEK